MEIITIIAGAGDLPEKTAKKIIKDGNKPFVIALNGYCDPNNWKLKVNFKLINILKVGKIFKAINSIKSNKVVIIGAVNRPNFSFLNVDLTGAKLLYKLLKNRSNLGDDNMFKIIMGEFKAREIELISYSEIMGYENINPGVLTKNRPSKIDFDDIERGKNILQTLAKSDVGQSVVVQNGLVLCVEAAEGTDRMINRAGELKRKGKPPLLIKLLKLGQTKKIDVPTIGIETLKNCKKNGFSGIAFSHDGVILVDKNKIIKFANENKLFLVAI